MKIGKLVFGGAMASILMMGGAFADVTTGSLTTKAYVDDGLKAAYNAAVGKAGTNADTKIQSALGTLGTVTDESGTRNMTVAEFVEKSLTDAGLDPEGNVSESIAGLQDTIGTLPTEANATYAKTGTVGGDLSALDAAIATLNGGDTVEGSVAKQIKDAIADDNGVITTTISGLIDEKEVNLSKQFGYNVKHNPENANPEVTDSLVKMLNMNHIDGDLSKGLVSEAARQTSLVDAINANTTAIDTKVDKTSVSSSVSNNATLPTGAAVTSYVGTQIGTAIGGVSVSNTDGYVDVVKTADGVFTVNLKDTPVTDFATQSGFTFGADE